MAKSKISVKTNDKFGDLSFLIPKVKKSFTKLKQIFTKALMLTHFKPDGYIQIKMDASGYVIKRILSQLILQISNWYSIIYFLRDMIPAKT